MQLTFVALHEVTWHGAGSVEYTEHAETASVSRGTSHVTTKQRSILLRVQELCESGGGRPGLSVLMSLTVSVDVKQH